MDKWQKCRPNLPLHETTLYQVIENKGRLLSFNDLQYTTAVLTTMGADSDDKVVAIAILCFSEYANGIVIQIYKLVLDCVFYTAVFTVK